MDIKSYIDELFKYLQTYETKYNEFDAEAFLQTYNGIYTVFRTLRQQREEAVDVDRYFLERIQQVPINSSDLRQLTIQTLITYFESEADIDGHSNKAYLYCRDLRPSKRDISFFDNHLVPILFKEGGLNSNFRLNSFFLKEIGRYMNKFGGAVNSGMTPEAFDAMSDPNKFLELQRRRLVLGKELLNDRSSLEFHLQRVDGFNKLSKKGKIYDLYLSHWQYLKKTTFLDKVKEFFSALGGKIVGAFSSFRHFKLVMTQRNAAYLLYGFILVVFIFLAIYIPMKWVDYSQNRLEKFQDRAAEVQGGR